MKHTVNELTLKNGLKTLVLQVPDAPVIACEISFRAGEFLLTRNKWETAHIMEHMMLGANDDFATSREFQATLEKNGAYSNASTSVYDITYEIESAHFDTERVLDLLIGAMQKPIFKANEFKAEFGNVAEELEGRSNNHFRTLNIAIRAAQGLYSVSDTERVGLMQHVSKDDVRAHYSATHSIDNARCIIAGNVTKHHLNVLAKLKFDCDIKHIDMPVEIPKQANAPLVITKKDVPNYYFYIDMYANKRLSQRERDALGVLSTLLTETLHSLLFGAAREKGLVYAMGSGQQHIKSYSSFWLGAQVSKKNAVELFNLIADMVGHITKNGVTAKDLQAAKLYMLGNHERSAQTVRSLLSRYSAPYFRDDVIANELGYDQRILEVTNDDIKNALKTVLSGPWMLGLLGDVPPQHATQLYDILKPVFAD